MRFVITDIKDYKYFLWTDRPKVFLNFFQHRFDLFYQFPVLL